MRTGPRRHPAVNWVDVDGDVVAVDARDGQVHTMRGATAIVWRLLDGRPIDQLTSELAQEHSLSVERIRTDVDIALGQMVGSDLLDVGASEGGGPSD